MYFLEDLDEEEYEIAIKVGFSEFGNTSMENPNGATELEHVSKTC